MLYVQYWQQFSLKKIIVLFLMHIIPCVLNMASLYGKAWIFYAAISQIPCPKWNVEPAIAKFVLNVIYLAVMLIRSPIFCIFDGNKKGKDFPNPLGSIRWATGVEQAVKFGKAEHPGSWGRGQ